MVQTIGAKLQIPAKLIYKDIGPEIPDVIKIIYRRATIVDPNPPRIGWLKRFLFAGKGIEYGEAHLY